MCTDYLTICFDCVLCTIVGLPLLLSVVYLVITRELLTLLHLFIRKDIIKKYILTSLGIYSTKKLGIFNTICFWEGADVRYRIKPG